MSSYTGYGALNSVTSDVATEEKWPGPKLTNKFVFENAMSAAEYKADIPWAKTLLMGFTAGTYISIGALLAIIIAGGCPDLVPGYVGLQKLLFGITFPVGLMLVTIAGADLVTSNLALLPAAWLEGRISIWQLIRNWFFAYFGNMAGCFFLCLIAVNSGILSNPDNYEDPDTPWITFVQSLVYKKTHLPFLQAFTRGFLCNWLVCLAVYNTNAANDLVGKVVGLWPCIMAFAAMGFEHSVANMFILPLGWAYNALDVNGYTIFVNNIIPVTFGNLCGAVVMVSINYAVTFGRTGERIASLWNRMTTKED